MGGIKSKEKVDFNSEVNFAQFKLLRSVGKGAFGKVCIVMKRDTKKLYAMKYMNKQKCIEEKAVKNVLNERKILDLLNHPLMVNLWFAFQDDEDMFMVVDLMLGGDLRYHLQRYGPFTESRVRQYAAELSCALEYIHSQNIIHRDIKPDNILMDSDGHVHLADFNVAAFLPPNGILHSRAGTRPYMAPEMVLRQGYTVGADWWSLGVTLLELLRGKNPFRGSTAEEVAEAIVSLEITYPSNLHEHTVAFLHDLLDRDMSKRIGTPQSMDRLKKHVFFANLACPWEDVPKYGLKPEFVPDKDKVNCDAMYELEEMMLEENPLHKKKQRLKHTSSTNMQNQPPPEPGSFADEKMKLDKKYLVFNREKVTGSATAGFGTPGRASAIKNQVAGYQGNISSFDKEQSVDLIKSEGGNSTMVKDETPPESPK
eukprot:comp23045_c1_seq1/m.36878 comp23045_c1_seq1/g.36878  ORF comp23045_c1_seq1/g.36878 comp23045_c1_seq1/m.36878 type:complete len:426 (-) comp23045_c1_seq1:188-1465(-)